tara:strand:- start:262 stop:651 length:390 start_codon:yes stop_codon:yes gene_type:complete
MYVHQHIILSIITLILLTPIIKIYALIAALALILIDFDHYLFYLIYFKDYSLKNAHHYFLNNPKRTHLFIFHTIEFWTLLLILSTITPFFLAILIGIFLHITQDLIFHIQHPKTLKYKPYSLILYLRKT